MPVTAFLMSSETREDNNKPQLKVDALQDTVVLRDFIKRNNLLGCLILKLNMLNKLNMYISFINSILCMIENDRYIDFSSLYFQNSPFLLFAGTSPVAVSLDSPIADCPVELSSAVCRVDQ